MQSLLSCQRLCIFHSWRYSGMGKYFINVETLEQLRRQYKELLKKFHPDNGGSEEIMKAVNVEYDKLFKVLKDKHAQSQFWLHYTPSAVVHQYSVSPAQRQEYVAAEPDGTSQADW